MHIGISAEGVQKNDEELRCRYIPTFVGMTSLSIRIPTFVGMTKGLRKSEAKKYAFG